MVNPWRSFLPNQDKRRFEETTTGTSGALVVTPGSSQG